MRITAIRDCTIAIPSAYRTASIDFDSMTASVVLVETDAVRNTRPVFGLALDSIGRYSHGGLLRERFIPRLLAADPDAYSDGAGSIDPIRAWPVLMRNEKPGGHGERAGAVGLLDAALWDIAAKMEDRPLWHVLADRFGAADATGRIPVYASGGHYRPSDDVAFLQADIAAALDRGHDHFKIKIGAIPLADDLRRVEAALTLLGPGRLAVDGNGSFDHGQMHAYAAALSGWGLAWLEEPVDPLDFDMHAELAQIWPHPIATGENLFSLADLRNLLRYGGLRPDRDLLQMDISLSYGLPEYLRMLSLLPEFGWSAKQCVPHVGHLLAMHAVAGLGLGRFETAADTTSPFGGFPAGATLADGHMMMSDAPGLGFEATPHLHALFRPLRD